MDRTQPSHAACFVLAGALLAALPACSSDDGASPPGGSPNNGSSSAPNSPTPTGPGGSSAPNADGGSEAPPPPCDEAKMAAVKASFDDDTIPDDVGGVAIIKDRSCGSRYFTRGVSKDVPETALHLIASTTKTYIASLTLLLAEEGKISLSDPASKWLTGVPGGDAVKVSHLLNHTSGIFNYTGDLGYVASFALGLMTKYTPQQLLDMAFKKALAFEPGAAGKWSYSNTNYVMLGMIIESVTGKGIAEVLRSRILAPIGAKATFFTGSEAPSGDYAPAVTFRGSPGATFLDPSASWCTGNLTATVGDLADWTEKRGSGTFHSAAMQAEMAKSVVTGLADITYGSAYMTYAEGAAQLNGNGPAIGHDGATAGYHTQAFYFPKSKATIVLIVQGDKGPKGNFPLNTTYVNDLYLKLLNPYFGTTPKGP